MTKLSADTLAEVGNQIAVPAYDRDQVRTGIVHLGVGGFHRAHQARQNQDAFYTKVVKHADGSLEARGIGSIEDHMFTPERPDAVLERLVDPATRIMSLTITEGAYHVNAATGEFDDTDPDIRVDIEASRRHGLPRTAFGFVIEAGARRRVAGTAALARLCDEDLSALALVHGRESRVTLTRWQTSHGRVSCGHR